jgi:hypothetical protein
MHVAGFRSVFAGSLDPVITGRYLLPLMAVYGAALVLALSWLPRPAARVAGCAVLGVLVVVQVCATGLVLERFYA